MQVRDAARAAKKAKKKPRDAARAAKKRGGKTRDDKERTKSDAKKVYNQSKSDKLKTSGGVLTSSARQVGVFANNTDRPSPDIRTSLPLDIENMDEQERLAAAMDEVDFLNRLGLSKQQEIIDLESCRCEDIPMQEREQMVQMVENDLKDFYNDAWGWDREDKKKELFANVSRFLVARSKTGGTDIDKVNKNISGKEKGEIVGFAMFRFCWDDDNEPEFPILYLYELNVVSSHRGTGLAKVLMETLVEIVKYFGLWKMMLTCFKANTRAIAFYKKCGMGVDIYSPSRCDGMDVVKYEIMSNDPDKRDNISVIIQK
jgi:N-alpha-acetyltransferase 40